MQQKPSPARMLIALVDPAQNNGADTAPAVVTRVWGEHPDGGWSVNVRVLLDAFTVPLWLTSVRLVDDEATARAAGSSAVYWPPRV